MATLAKSHLLALNVVLLPRGASRDIAESLRVDLNAKAKAVVVDVAKNAESAHVAESEGRVLETDRSVVETITSFAREEGVDLIVLGTKGTSAIPRFMLGSVAAGVVNAAHCSALAVR